MAPRMAKSKRKPKGQVQGDTQPSAEASINHEDVPLPLAPSGVGDNGSSHVQHMGSETPISGPIDSAPQNPDSALSATASGTTRPVVKRNPIRGGRANSGANAPSSTSGSSESKPRALKYQPKANVVRRSKEEREAQDRAEEERRLARLRANATKSNYRGGFHARGRGRGGRGNFRGGMNRWRDQRQVASTASGPLSGGPTVGGPVSNRGKSTRGATRGFSYTGDFNNNQSIKAERSFLSKSETIVKDEYQDISKEDDIGPCINIEHISLVTDDEESDEDPIRSKGKGREKGPKAPGWVVRPVRLERHEHAERQTKVSTDPSSAVSAELRRKKEEKQEEDLAPNKSSRNASSGQTEMRPEIRDFKETKDVIIVKEERPWKGVYQDKEDQDAVLVKTEPGDEQEGIMVGEADTVVVPIENLYSEKPANDASAVGRLPTEEPATTDIASKQTSTDKTLLPTPNSRSHGVSPANEEIARKVRRKNRIGLNLGPRKPVLQTPEDHEEWERYQNDMTAVSEELGSTTFSPKPVPASQDQEGDIPMEDSKAEGVEHVKDRREGMVYLLQLPPIMPNLVNEEKVREFREAKKAQKEWDLKQERSKKEKTKAKAITQKDKVGITKAAPQVKAEPQESRPDIPDVRTTLRAGDDIESTGDVGTLKVYQSGKVILDWGGMKFSVGMGAPGDALQEAVLMNHVSVKKEEDTMDVDMVSTATSLGQIGGGFNMAPHWPSIL